MKCSLGISNFFLTRSLVNPILLFSSISLHWSLRKAFLSLLHILWNIAFKCVYLSFFPLLFASLLFTAICKASSNIHFAFLHFFSLRMILIPVSYTTSWTSIHNQRSQRKTNIRSYCLYVESRTNDANEFTYKTGTDSQRMNLWLLGGKGRGRDRLRVWYWHIHRYLR